MTVVRKVRVTQEDIDHAEAASRARVIYGVEDLKGFQPKGLPKNVMWGLRSQSCPIALALNRVGPGDWHGNRSSAGDYDVSLMFWGKRRQAVLPPAARMFVRNFDRGRPVGPMEFEIRFD